MNGYKWFGFNRQALHVRAPKGSGGVGILVRDSLFIDYSVKVVDRSYEGVIGMQMQHKLSDYSVLFYSCYLPPENSPWGRDAIGFYSHLLTQTYMYSDADAVMFCGDFNSRIGSMKDSISDLDSLPDRKCLDQTVNQHGISLVEFLQESKYCVLNGRISSGNDAFTCRTARGLSVVDFFLVAHDMVGQCSELKVESCVDIVQEHGLQKLLNSRSKLPDHAYLNCKLCINVLPLQAPENQSNVQENAMVNRRYFFKRKQDDFMKSDMCRQSLLRLIESIECNRESQEEVDSIYSTFQNTVIAEMNRSVPYADSCSKVRKRFKPRKSFWNDELDDLWSDMNKKEKLVRKCSCRNRRKALFVDFRSAQCLFDKRFRFFERKYRLEVCESIELLQTNDPKQFWEQLKSFGPRKRKGVPMEVYVGESEVSTDPDVVLNTWKSDFSKLYNNFEKPSLESARFKEQIKLNNSVREQNMLDPLFEGTDLLNCNISLGEVRAVVMKSKLGKSPGVDLLPNEVFKSDLVIEVLHKLFQLCLDSGMIPCIWRKAIISPIPKDSKADPRVPLNYRGISLLCCSAKLYTGLLNKRIDCFMQDKLVDEQNGFRKDRSCQDHIYALDSIIRNRLNDNLTTFVAFVDLQKAFDCVDRDFLMHKLLNAGVNGKMYFAIKNIYSVTNACVKLSNGIKSEWFETLFGVRQGDSMSPSLFSIYLNDFAEEIKSLNAGIDIPNGRNVSLLLYADDIALLAPSEVDLQRMLDVLFNWSKKWCINVNKTKSKIIHFRHERTEISKNVFKCGESNISYVSSYKYLGVFFNEFLCYDENADILAQAAGRALGSIIAKYKSHKYMGYSTYTKLFDSCVCPVMEYAAGVWGYRNYNKINTVQHRAARSFLGVHRFTPTLALEGDMGWLIPKYRRWSQMLRLWNRLVSMPDDRVTKQIFVNDYYLAMSNFENWCTSIYRILNVLHKENLFYERQPCDIDSALQSFYTIQEEQWRRAIVQKPKLRFYQLFKSNLAVENYVRYNLTPSQRSIMAQFRAGILPLNIETGRFRNIKLEERLCTLCDQQEVESELHFLFDCSCYNHLRQPWLQNINVTHTSFREMSTEEKLCTLFDKSHRCTAKFILNCFNHRKDQLFQTG